MRRVASAAFLLTAASSIFAGVPVLAETSPSASSAPAVDAGTNVDLTGFRSAKFGTDEMQVRDAIAKDFGKAVNIKQSINPAERTRSLTIRILDVLPDGGTADIAYVLGYQTKKLIQVSVVWSKTTDPTITAEKLVADADVLRANFASQGYKADTIISDVAVKNGILVFRGSDVAGHTTALLLEGRTTADKDRKVFTPVSLVLLYIADPKHPDVFRLAPGQF